MTSLVYFLKGPDGLIKIGRTRHLPSRLQTLERQIGGKVEVLAAVAGASRLEMLLHREFAAHRRHGEWFEETPRLLRRIAELVEAQAAATTPAATFREAASAVKAKHFLSILLGNVIASRSADVSRLSAIDVVAAKLGASPIYIRKLLAMNEELAVEADFMIAVVDFYREFCSAEQIFALKRAEEMRDELRAAGEWIDRYTTVPTDANLRKLAERLQ